MADIRSATALRQFGPNHRWTILAVGVAAQASFSVAFSGLPVLGILMRHSYGLTNEQLGIVLGCMALGVGASEVLWGLLTDKLGDRRVLLAGLLSMGVMLVLMSLFTTPADRPGFLLLAISFVLVGALGASVNSSSGRAIMTWFTDGRRGFAMSIRQTAIPVGGALGAALLPPLAQRWGFQTVYAVLALLCLASASATWVWLYEAPVEKRLNSGGSSSENRSPLLRLDIWRLALASGLLTAPQIAILTFAGVYLHDEYQLSIEALAAVLIFVQLAGGALRILSGRLSDHFGNRRSFIRVFGVLAGISTVGLAAASPGPIWLILILITLSGLFSNAWHGVAFTEIAVMAGVSRAGSAIGLEGTTIFASAFITPFVIPIILGLNSWNVVWMWIGISALIAVPLAPGHISEGRKTP